MATNKTVFFMIGILLIVLGFSMLIPYTIQLIYNENSHSFVSSSFVTIFIGILFILANLEKEFKLNLKQTFLFSTLAWLMVAVFGSLPFLLSPKEFTFSEAFFESMSGITTTGATIITDLDKRLSAQKGIKVDFQAINDANHFFTKTEDVLVKSLDKYIKKESALF